MKQILLHIGPPKTASTSIQHFLVAVEEKLLLKKILYPKSGRLESDVKYTVYGGGNGKQNVKTGPSDAHHLLAWSILKKNGIADTHCWDQLFEEIQEKQPEIVILSAEDFSNFSDEHISKIHAYLKDYLVKVIFYARDPFERVISVYKHNVWCYNYRHSLKTFCSEENRLNRACNYDLVLSKWATKFGEENIQVKFFEKLKNAPGLEMDWIEVLGLDVEEFLNCIPRFQKNTSPSNEKLIFMRFLNMIEYYLGQKARKGFIGRTLLKGAKPFLSRSLYSQHEADSLKKMIEDMKQPLLAKYFKDEKLTNRLTN